MSLPDEKSGQAFFCHASLFYRERTPAPDLNAGQAIPLKMPRLTKKYFTY